MVYLNDKLTLEPQQLTKTKGVFTIVSPPVIRQGESNGKVYEALDLEINVEVDGVFKHSIYERDREFLIKRLGRETDKWVNAQIVYTVVYKAGRMGTRAVLNFESATPAQIKEEKLDVKA